MPDNRIAGSCRPDSISEAAGGGILPRHKGHVRFDGFLKGFHGNGPMSTYMKDIPVYLILSKDAAFMGAARIAREELKACGPDGC